MYKDAVKHCIFLVNGRVKAETRIYTGFELLWVDRIYGSSSLLQGRNPDEIRIVDMIIIFRRKLRDWIDAINYSDQANYEVTDNGDKKITLKELNV
jgi:hypothetical protein